MAEKCANCGRADLLAADIANLQCLACGSLTSIETGQVVQAQEKTQYASGFTTTESLSNAGLPVVELSKDVQEAPADDFDRRNRYVGPQPELPRTRDISVESRPARVEPSYAPAVPVEAVEASKVDYAPWTQVSTAKPVDLNTLTPEQIEAIQKIAYPDGD
jgi:hypothetical protein